MLLNDQIERIEMKQSIDYPIAQSLMSDLHTSYITNSRAPKNPDQLTRRSTVVTDRNNVAQGCMSVLRDFVKDVHEAVCRRAP